MKKYIVFWCWLWAAIGAVQAQNPTPQTPSPTPKNASDTTKNKKKDSVQYSPLTTRFFYEYEVFEHQAKIRNPDTSYYNRHRYNYLQRNRFNAQDLGTMGSPFQLLGYQAPKRIGTRLGVEVYDVYPLQSDSIPYFNTMSPYTNLEFVQGGVGRILLNIDFSRNIKPDWNFSLHYRQIESDKVFARSFRKNDIYALLMEMGATMSYFSPQHRYKIMGSFFHYNHLVNDNGGYIINDTIRDLDKLFEVENDAELVYQLSKAKSEQSRRKFRLYQQYAVFDSSSVQLFHALEWSRQWNSYEDADIAQTSAYYYKFPINPTLLGSKPAFYGTVLDVVDNTVGIKGKWKGIYYRAFGQMRQYDYTVRYQNTRYKGVRDTLAYEIKPAIKTETYFGAALRYDFRDSIRVGIEALQLLDRDSRFRALVNSPWGNLQIEQSLYRPSLWQQRIYGTFYNWDNTNFAHTQSTEIRLNSNFSVPYITAQPTFQYVNVQNYVYFDSTGTARQSATAQQYWQAGFNMRAQWRKFVNNTNILFTQTAQSPLIRIPTWQITSQFYWESPLFKGALTGQIGFDLHWKSRYFANAYSPAAQQFIVQDRYSVGNFLIADVFFNFRVKRVVMFIKVNNVLLDIWRKGYYDTPRYFAQPRSFELGVTWKFFD